MTALKANLPEMATVAAEYVLPSTDKSFLPQLAMKLFASSHACTHLQVAQPGKEAMCGSLKALLDAAGLAARQNCCILQLSCTLQLTT